jgi:hypothetical protein
MRSSLSLMLVVLGLLMACSSQRGDSKQSSAKAEASPANSAVDAVSPVSGPSWLKHLGLAQPQTHMG